MRLPHVRVTGRRLAVVAVVAAVVAAPAVVAATAWALQTWWQGRGYSRQAAYHAYMGQRAADAAVDAERCEAQARQQLPEILACAAVAAGHSLNGREVTRAEFVASCEQTVAEMAATAARERARAAYHAGQERKYLRAAARPWRPVAPDPPPS